MSCKVNFENKEKIECFIEQMYSQDYIDKESDKKSVSVEDEIWQSKVQSSTKKLSSGYYEIVLPLKR